MEATAASASTPSASGPGLTLPEFAERFPEEYAAWQAGTKAAPGAETDADVVARFVPALRAALDALGPGETGVVVTHGAALRAALAELLDFGSTGRDALGVLGNGHWVELAHSASGFLGGAARWRLAGYNLAAASPVAAEAPAPGSISSPTSPPARIPALPSRCRPS